MKLPGEDLLQAAGAPREPVLIVGALTGILLSGVMAGALFAANRMPQFEHWALERNALSIGVFSLVMMIPVFRFRRAPRKLLACGMLAWTIFLLSYLAAGILFTQLYRVLRTPFEVLVDGALAYGLLAAGMWISGMIFLARRHHHRRRSSEPRPHAIRAGR